jgi:Sugar (and other) transporter
LWIAGLNTITYMLSTLVCVFTLDRIGRRWTLYWGSVGQGITLFLAGGLCKLAKDSTGSKATESGNAAVAMVFLFTMIFGATWLTV